MVTLRLQDNHQFKLKPLGPNHREILLAMDNSDGSIPFLTKEVEGKFTMPVEFLWSDGSHLTNIFKLGIELGNPWKVVTSYCHFLLSNETLTKELKDENFNLAIVDLIYNECALALANHGLKLPTVSYWAFSFAGGEAEFTVSPKRTNLLSSLY